MTFREAIQIQIKALQVIYDNAEGLRDIATDKDKEAFNDLRRYLPPLWGMLGNVDNNLSDADAKYQCKGNYNVISTTDNI